MKRNVSELTGFELDWAVGVALGKVWIKTKRPFQPSTVWGDGGPIIEQEKIGTWPSEAAGKERLWGARMLNTYISYAPTPLIAAMRCFVESRLGEEIDIPDNLEKE